MTWEKKDMKSSEYGFCFPGTNSSFAFKRLYITMQKKKEPRGGKKISNSHFLISLRLSFQTKDYFLAASHAGIALQGLPRLKGNKICRYKRAPSRFFVTLDDACNLGVSPVSLFRTHTSATRTERWIYYALFTP